MPRITNALSLAFNEIPVEESDDVTEKELLKRLVDAGVITSGETWDARRAGGGLNTEVFFVEQQSDGESLTVRLARSGIDLRREARYLSHLQACPGVPHVKYADRDILVHDKLSGEPGPLAEASDADLDALARTLACMHSHTVDHYILWPDLTKRHGTRAELLRARIASLPEYRSFEQLQHDDLDALYQVLCEIELDGPDWGAEQFGLIHGDLSIGNILWSEGGVSLIDWEYVRPSDPAEELAYIITEQPVGDALRRRLRNAYIAHGGVGASWERVGGWAAFTALDSAFWWCDHLLERGEEPTHHPEVLARIATVKRWL